MKPWLGLALAGLGVCLLLALGHPEVGRGMDSHPWVACGARSVGPWGEPALASPSAARAAQKATPCQAHTAPPESRAVHLVLLTPRGIGPPWLDSRGPPGKVCATLVDSGAAGQTDSRKPRGSLYFPNEIQAPLAGVTARRGFCNSL
jgi:hypothetical protein